MWIDGQVKNGVKAKNNPPYERRKRQQAKNEVTERKSSSHSCFSLDGSIRLNARFSVRLFLRSTGFLSFAHKLPQSSRELLVMIPAQTVDEYFRIQSDLSNSRRCIQ